MARYNTQYAYADNPRAYRSGRPGANGSRPRRRSSDNRSGSASTSARSERNNRSHSSSRSGRQSQNDRNLRRDRENTGTRYGGAQSTRYDHRTNRPRHVLTEREREALRQRKIRKLKIQAKKRRVRNARLLFLAVTALTLFVLYKLVTGITSYIDASRDQAKQAMQNIDMVTKNTSIDLSGDSSPDSAAAPGGGQSTGDPNAGTGNTLDTSDPTHILSNGRYLDATKPMIALTFDDGPKAEYGNRIMDALESVNGRGTFFMVGNLVAKYPDEVKRMVSDGHEVANHSYNHDSKLSKKDAATIRSNFDQANAAIQQVSGVMPSLIRLPGGNISDNVRAAVSLPMIHWSLDTKDWKTRNASSIIQTVLSQVKDGDIILMHEIYDSTASAVEQLVPQLTQQGYQLVTVSELIQLRNASVQGGNGQQYKCFPPTAESQAALSAQANAPAESSAAETSAETSAAAPAAPAAPAVKETTAAKPASPTVEESAKAPAETAANGIHLAPAKPVTIGNNTAGATVEEHSGHEIIEAVDPGAA